MRQIFKLLCVSNLNKTHKCMHTAFPENNLATSWLLCMRGADWPVLHPSPHQWYLCVVLALPLLSMVPKREREIRKEAERKRETLLLRNISLSDIPLWFWCENSNIFSCVICAISLLHCHWHTQLNNKTNKNRHLIKTV